MGGLLIYTLTLSGVRRIIIQSYNLQIITLHTTINLQTFLNHNKKNSNYSFVSIKTFLMSIVARAGISYRQRVLLLWCVSGCY